MSDVTGPISTLPGSRHAVPDGAMCDEHPDRPATTRVQGETDSYGSEMLDLCSTCATSAAAGFDGVCDWCEQDATSLKPVRDYDEGMTGPVYYVCQPCRRERHQRAEDEIEGDVYRPQESDLDGS